MTNLCVIGMLGIFSWQDIKEKQVAVGKVLLFGIIGLIVHMLFRELTLEEMLGGMCVGIIVLGLSFISKGQIGAGDGLVILVLGIYLGFWGNMELMLVASILTGGVALILLLFKKVQRGQELPFIPFLLAAFCIQVVLGVIIK